MENITNTNLLNDTIRYLYNILLINEDDEFKKNILIKDNNWNDIYIKYNIFKNNIWSREVGGRIGKIHKKPKYDENMLEYIANHCKQFAKINQYDLTIFL